MSEWNKKRKVIRHYDRIARIYEKQYSEEQNAKIDAILRHMCLNEKSFVLDVGCGTGILFPVAAIKVQSVIGVDTSSKLLQKAKKYTKKFTNIHIICADSDYLPFQNNIFDIVFAITLLQNLPNSTATLEEIKRTSKSESIIAVTALKKEFSEEIFTELLKNAQLKILTTKTDEKLKDYIALCKPTK
jgi:ubiquinone/menaquinone biosynthesis C-methylase UbiE